MPRCPLVLESLESRTVPAASFFLLPQAEADAPFLLGGTDPALLDDPVAPVAITGLGAGEIPAVLVEPAQGSVVSMLCVSGNGDSASFYTIDTASGVATPTAGFIVLTALDGRDILFPDPAGSAYEATLLEDGSVSVSVSENAASFSFLVDTATGQAVDADPVAEGIQPQSLWNQSAVPPEGLPGDGFFTWSGLVPDFTGVTGIGAAEWPALVVSSGEVEYILAVDIGARAATLYVDNDPLDGVRDFTVVGAPGDISLIDGSGQLLQFPDPSIVYYWSWIDSESGEIHVSYAAGGMLAGFRVSSVTGLAIDGDDAADGTQPDYLEIDQLFSLMAGEVPPVPELAGIPYDPSAFLSGFMHFLFRGMSDMFMSLGGAAASFSVLDEPAGADPEPNPSLESPVLARALDVRMSVPAGGMYDSPATAFPMATAVASIGRELDMVPSLPGLSQPQRASGVRRHVDHVSEKLGEEEEMPESDDSFPAVPDAGAQPNAVGESKEPTHAGATSAPDRWIPLAEDTLPYDPLESSMTDAHSVMEPWAIAGFLGGVAIATMPPVVRRDPEFFSRRRRKENLIDSCFGGFGI